MALVYTPVIAYLHNHPLLSALRNIRKYRGTSQSLELNNRLADAERRYKKALASNEASHTFFANMSHELRTPFQGLLGMLDLVGNSPWMQRNANT